MWESSVYRLFTIESEYELCVWLLSITQTKMRRRRMPRWRRAESPDRFACFSSPSKMKKTTRSRAQKAQRNETTKWEGPCIDSVTLVWHVCYLTSPRSFPFSATHEKLGVSNNCGLIYSWTCVCDCDLRRMLPVAVRELCVSSFRYFLARFWLKLLYDWHDRSDNFDFICELELTRCFCVRCDENIKNKYSTSTLIN